MASPGVLNAAQIVALKAEIQALTYTVGNATAANAKTIADNQRDMDIAWLVICGALVFFMQAGFSMLEAGTVSKKNVVNILFKNLVDACVAAVAFWLLGYGFAYGDTAGGFIGTTNFGCAAIFNGAGDGRSDDWVGWFFQWAFSGAVATIVSGSVAERCKFEGYIVISLILTAFIYPVVVHWGWGSGFLSAWGAMPDAAGDARPLLSGTSTSNGMIDFAGSGIVHMTGGVAGLVGAIILGPRIGRFDPITKAANDMPGSSSTMCALGTFILWFGWYGFNCGSTLMISANAANLAGKVAMTTTLSAAGGALTTMLMSKALTGHYDVALSLNGILAGLVGITAGCSVVNPWMAFLIGIISGIVYIGSHYLLLKMRVDDPLDAFPIHGACGAWGVIAVGIFCTDANVQYAAYPNVNDACARGEQFGVQIIGVVAIAAWTAVMCGISMGLIHMTMGLRVSQDVETAGLDISEHGYAGSRDGVSAFMKPTEPTVVKVNAVAPTGGREGEVA